MQILTRPSSSIRPYGLSYAHSSKGGALRPFVVSRFRLVGVYSAQCFIIRLAWAKLCRISDS